jgi:hypothetical protein
LALIVLLSVGLCGVISAIPTLPVWEYSHFANRGDGVSYDFSTYMSLPPSDLETLFIPDLYGSPLGQVPSVNPFPMVSYWELCLYVGILSVFLCVLAILFWRTRHIGLFLFFAIFSLLFSFGDYFPLYSAFYHYIPGFSLFRIPARMLFVFTFSLAMIAGFGIDAVFNNNVRKKNRFSSFFGKPVIHLVCICIAVAGMSLLAVSYIEHMIAAPYIVPALLVWIAFTTLFCLGPVILKDEEGKVRKRNLLQLLLICILIVDLFSFGMRFVDTKSPTETFENPGFVPIIKNETDSYFRIYDETGLLGQNIAYRNNLYLINGYDPTYLKEYQSFFIQSQSVNYSGHSEWMQGAVIGNFDILRQLNVRYIITRRNYDSNEGIPGRGVSGLQLVYDNDSVLVYRLNFTYPRAYLIPLSEFNNATPVSFQPAEIEQYSPNTITVKATTDTPEYLILSEIYYPGWTALDNSRPVEIIRYQNVFRAVYLDPGSHQVTFTYFPKILTF